MRTPFPGAFVVVVGLLVGGSSACGKNEQPTAPTPQTPPPAPAPPPPAMFTLGGTVRETFPTASVLLSGAVVQILDGPNAGRSVTTDGEGAFTFGSLTPGGFTVQGSLAGYETRTVGVTLDQNQTIRVELPPVFQQLDETITGTISGGDALCPDSIFNRPCKKHGFGSHHGGTVSVELDWDGSADLDLELWRGGTRIASSFNVGEREMVSVNSASAASYQIRVVYFSGAVITDYTLTVSRPN